MPVAAPEQLPKGPDRAVEPGRPPVGPLGTSHGQRQIRQYASLTLSKSLRWHRDPCRMRRPLQRRLTSRALALTYPTYRTRIAIDWNKLVFDLLMPFSHTRTPVSALPEFLVQQRDLQNVTVTPSLRACLSASCVAPRQRRRLAPTHDDCSTRPVRRSFHPLYAN